MGAKRKCPECDGPMTLLEGQTIRPTDPGHVQHDHVHMHYRCEDPHCGVTYREDAPGPLGGDDGGA
jgi:hypothetical protein